jgi:hypothetical protein
MLQFLKLNQFPKIFFLLNLKLILLAGVLLHCVDSLYTQFSTYFKIFIMVRMIIIISTLLVLASCKINKFPYDYKGLTYKNKFKHTNQMQMNGYFYSLQKNGISIHYFFDDGYYLMGGSIRNITDEPICYQINEKSRRIPFDWGVFIIDNDTIRIQRIAAYGRDKYGKFMVEELWAKIEDDGSTLRYFQKKDIDGKISLVNEIYKFHPCANKPTSDNILMQENKR